jgi:hypothetical protein
MTNCTTGICRRLTPTRTVTEFQELDITMLGTPFDMPMQAELWLGNMVYLLLMFLVTSTKLEVIYVTSLGKRKTWINGITR